jgi:hypothetical protein
VLARSDGQTAVARAGGPASAQDRVLLAAAAECFDQAQPVVWPALDTAEPVRPTQLATQRTALPPPIHRAHAALALGRADKSPAAACVASLPLVVDGRRVGVLCVRRLATAVLRAAVPADPSPAVVPAGTPRPGIDVTELQQLQHLAGLAAPLLWLMQRNERSTAQRAHDALADLWSRARSQRRTQLQALGAAAVALALVTLLLPWPAQVGGRARIEGVVQRVLAAPADGFVQQVHARAGDTVRAGQTLLELADQDLQLERQRWQSQLLQNLDALASAQARADRSQLVLHQSRADEAQAQLALVDEKLQRSRLVAPFDATVVQGDWSQQLGAPVKQGAEMLTLAPLGRYRVMVEIDERDVGRLQTPTLGAAASTTQGVLTLSALPWDSLPLRVTRVSPLAKAVEGRNVFEVEAELAAPAPAATTALRPGLQGRAHLDAAPASPLLHTLRRALGALRVLWWEWWG